MINRFKKAIYLYVFMGFFLAHAGSYEDFFAAIKKDDAATVSALLARGIDPSEATRRAGDMLARLNLPERLWTLAPSTFSGGEQQRVNIARSFVDPTAIMLLDEPTASLDAANRDVVVHLIDEARNNGAAIIGIFHDEAVRDRIATRRLDLTAYRAAA